MRRLCTIFCKTQLRGESKLKVWLVSVSVLCAILASHESMAQVVCQSNIENHKVDLDIDPTSNPLLRLGHASSIADLSLSPDGRHVVTVGSDGKAILWDVCSGSEINTFLHSHGVRAVSFLDANRFATAMDDGTLSVWNTTGKTAVANANAKDSISQLRSSPDGRDLWVSSMRHGVFVVDTATLTVKSSCPNEEGVAVARVASKDGTYRVVHWNGTNVTVDRWNSGARTLIRTYQLGTGSQIMDFDKGVSSATVSEDGSIALGTKDGLLYIFKADDTPPTKYAGHSGAVGAVSIDSSNMAVASISEDGHLLLIRDLRDGRLIKRIADPAGYSPRVAMISSDEVLISTVGENGIRYIRLSDGSTHDLRGVAAIVRQVSTNKDGAQLVTSTWKHIRMWSPRLDGYDQVYFPRAYAGHNTTNAKGTLIYATRGLPYDNSHSFEVRSIATGELSARIVQSRNVSAAAYSEDGKELALGQVNGDIDILDAATGKIFHSLRGHTSAVSSITYGDNGTLLTQSEDNTARVWNIAGEKELWREDAFDSLGEVFSPSGRLAATWTGGQITVFDVAQHRSLAVLSDANKYDFSPDDSLLFVNGKTGSLDRWQPDTKQVSSLVAVNDEDATVMAASPSRALLCQSGSASIVDTMNARVVREFSRATCSSGGPPHVLAENQGSVELWDVATTQLANRLPVKGTDIFREFSVSPNRRYIMTRLDSFKSIVFDISSGKAVREVDYPFMNLHHRRSSLPHFARDGEHYLTSQKSEDVPQTAVDVLDTRGSNEPRQLFVQPYAVESLSLSPNERFLLTCSGDSTMRLSEANTGKTITEQSHACTEAQFSRDGTKVIATEVGDHKSPRIWSADLKQEEPSLTYDPTNVIYFSLASDRSKLLTVADEGRLTLWDIDTGKELLMSGPPVSASIAETRGAELLVGGSIAVVGYSNGKIVAWDISNGKVLGDFRQFGAIRSLHRPSANDDVFFTIHDDGSVRIWSLLSNTPLRSFDAKEDLAEAASLSADGRLAVLARRNQVVIRDVASGIQKQIVAVPSSVIAVALNSEERDIVMACGDGKVRRYDLRKNTWKDDLGTIDPKSVLSIQVYGGFVVVTTRLGIVLLGDDIRTTILFKDGTPTRQGLMAAAPNQGLLVFRGGNSLDADFFDYTEFHRTDLFRESVTSTAISPNGEDFAVAYSSGWVRLWKLKTRTYISKYFVGGGFTSKLVYSRSGSDIFAESDRKAILDFNVASNNVRHIYSFPAEVTSFSPGGEKDRFLLVATEDSRVRIFEPDTGEEVGSIVVSDSGESWVFTKNGRFEGEAFKSSPTDGPDASPNASHGIFNAAPANKLWNSLLHGPDEVNDSTLSTSVGNSKGSTLNFDGTEVALDDSRNAAVEDPAPTGEGLRNMIKLSAGVLGEADKLTVNDGSRIETSPTGDIEIGTKPLEKVLQGHNFPFAIGFTAFVVSHEAWHSKQAEKKDFRTLPEEDHRLLECNADVLGTIDALKLATLFGLSREGLEAVAGVRNSQDRVAAISSIEGVDSQHPTEMQRKSSVEFGVARFFGRKQTEELASVQSSRQYDSSIVEDDVPWAEGVCKRILHYRSSDEKKLTAQIENERRLDARWEANLRYDNLSDDTLKVSHHVRLVGRAYSTLSGQQMPGLANIDGTLKTFTLKGHEQLVIPVSLASIDPPGIHCDATGIIFSNRQEENWMSIEVVNDGEDQSKKSQFAQDSRQESNISPTSFCSEIPTPNGLSDHQTELGVALVQISNDVGSGFQSFRRGTPFVGPLGSVPGTATAADVPLSFVKNAMVFDQADGTTSFRMEIDSDGTLSGASAVYGSTVSDLKALCPNFPAVEDAREGPDVSFKSARFDNFARGISVTVSLLRIGTGAPAVVSLTLDKEGTK